MWTVKEEVGTAKALAYSFSQIPLLVLVAKYLKTILFLLSRDLARVSGLGGGGYSHCRGPRSHSPHQHDPGRALQKEKL